MDRSSNQLLNQRALKKQLALYLTGSSQAYQSFKRIQELKGLYPNDFHYYNDTFYYRHDRNIQEIKKIKQLIKKGIMKPQMLLYNTWNTFYASYVMNHHFSVYLPILSLFAQSPEIKETLNKAKQMQQLGFFAQKVISIHFGKFVNDYQPQLNRKGQIEMNEDYFFFEKHVSLYYHVGCILVSKQNDSVLVFVRLRDGNGKLLKQIGVRDFGSRISSEYLQIGFNFNKIKPFLAIKVTDTMKIIGISNTGGYFTEFNLSILDLKKSLSLAIKYTQMRTQFKTLPNSKLQRPIATYQAVGVRLINAFSKLVCFSELNKALFNNKQIIPFAAPLLDINHHLMLECVIRLRQCCGGFGYLQVAGHAGCIERLAFRASQTFIAEIPENKQILKRLHYYSSSDKIESYLNGLITKQNAFMFNQIFIVFVNICINMRKLSNQISKQVFLGHFMYQASIQILKATEQFASIPHDSVWFLVLFYSCVCYILENSEYISWIDIEKQLNREDYCRGLNQLKNSYLNKLMNCLPLIEELLQVDNLRNCIMGRLNSKQFYDEVLLVSRQNLRNSEQFKKYVKQPIIQFLTENNAKL